MKILIKIIIKIYKLAIFAGTYVLRLIMANILIARDIVSINPRIKPGIIEIKMEVKKDHEILSLVNLISMTPGSLCIDISADKKYMYIHEMYLEDVEQVKKDINTKLEKKILELSN